LELGLAYQPLIPRGEQSGLLTCIATTEDVSLCTGQVFGASGGSIVFLNTSSAANGTFIANGAGVNGGYGGIISFSGTSTAGDGNFTANGSAGGNYGGFIEFFESSSAGNSTCTANPPTGGILGGFIEFYSSVTAGNATLIANDGFVAQIRFAQGSTGGTSRIKVFGGGTLTIDFDHDGVTIGSLEGTGEVDFGRNTLTIGSNNQSTTFSGTMQDSGQGGPVTKIGTGTLTLSGASSYTGTTTIEEGTLLAQHNAAPTGTGPVQVNAGTLGGRGKISGSVTVGSGSGQGRFSLPV
jgi:autotransporter-associated beta strand protein